MYQQILQTLQMEWEASDFPGISYKALGDPSVAGPQVLLYRFEPGATVPAHFHTTADETAYVIEGDFLDGGVRHGPGTVLIGPAGEPHGPHGTWGGCLVLFVLSRKPDFVLAAL